MKATSQPGGLAEALCALLARVFVCGVVSRWCVCVCCAWCWAVQEILRRTFALSRAAPREPQKWVHWNGAEGCGGWRVSRRCLRKCCSYCQVRRGAEGKSPCFLWVLVLFLDKVADVLVIVQRPCAVPQIMEFIAELMPLLPVELIVVLQVCLWC